MKIMYEKTPKSVLIKAYRSKLKEDVKNFTNRYNSTESVPSLKRPVVSGVTYSWVEFARLNRELIAVHCFLHGITIDGIVTVGDEEE